MRERRVRVALRETHQRVGIPNLANDETHRLFREIEHQHLGAAPIEPIEVTLKGLVQQDVTRRHPVPSRIARLDISSGEHHRREGTRMHVAQKLLARRVPQPSDGWRRDG
jgi:hypothetical protein